ncbi:MAG: methyltransferase domain-containing protein [Spirochaetes bacterium]|nr:methyltransferase domain-containing protein [Spirochaetota bacterium]
MSIAINERYSALAEKKTCLSCGGALARAGIRVGEVLVDLGSGRGNDVIKAVHQGVAFAYGVDISDGMLTKARENAREAGVDNVSFLKGELESLPLDDAIADVVISNCTINHAREKAAVWHEVWRILKPDGRFVVSDIYSTEPVPERFRNDPKAVAECWAGAVTREEYLATLRQAGFVHIQLLEESEPYAKGAVTVASITIAGKKPAV